MSQVILRSAAAADVPAISKLAIDGFVAKFGHLYSAENLNAFLEECLSPPAVASDLADPVQIYCLAELDGKLTGFAKISVKCGFPDHARGAAAMELKQLYTDPALTGQGIGARLMDWAMAELAARGADEVQLSVYAENFGAHRFYERYGFAKQADITFKVGDHIDPEFLYARLL